VEGFTLLAWSGKSLLGRAKFPVLCRKFPVMARRFKSEVQQGSIDGMAE
jgi:hypothetical protein